MGLIAGNLGLAPATRVTLDKKGFRNAIGGTSALYQQAQSNLDKAQIDLRNLVSKYDISKTKLNDWVSTYGDWYNQIKAGDYNGAIEKFVSAEWFGHPDSAKWGKVVGDLFNRISTKINPIDWYTIASGPGRIFNNGVAGNDPWNAAQRELVKYFANNYYEPQRKVLKDDADKIAGDILNKQKEIDKLVIDRDKAIAAEEKASGQRIKERESDPAYIKAKAEADRIVLEAGIRQKRNRNLLLLGLAGIALIGVIAVTQRK
jgi:hypothetical protein